MKRDKRLDTLVKNLVAHRHWKWIAGMAVFDPADPDFTGRVILVASSGIAMLNIPWAGRTILPDYTDGATIGAMIMCLPNGFIQDEDTDGKWSGVWEDDTRGYVETNKRYPTREHAALFAMTDYLDELP